MKAVIVNQPGSAEQLQIQDFEKPKLQPGEILIHVKAAAINRTDILSREGKAGYMSNPILGIEVSGEVVEAAPGVTLTAGTRVMGLVNGGGYAEYVTMPADRAIVVPDTLSFEEAAAIPEVFLTAYQTLFWLGQLKDDDTVLIHAGGSGVGSAAIQLAKQMTKAKIIVTAGSEEKLAFCRSLGADITINYKEQDFDEEVLNATNNQGVDVILDFIGASYWEKNLKSIKTDGRWVLIGILGGTEVEKVNIMQLLLKRIHLKGTLLTPRSDEYKKELTEEFVQNAMPLFAQKKVKAIVDSVFPLTDIQSAHKQMEANKNIGKIIIDVSL
ncbi:NAD(P)H-quinone oxidoreductase [Peribacillus psychrosaccharolyticus]|uniref:NAD(P)H-quinone oxidoreductase n=1 Tax=Peribacillus psychrosaccharolyticus TaxID=1407 RepID=A0A974NM95_PERPY|nr:NAD(P)H-quinone oxidoreductase [Peribacillus psychrosaccharolyticus]MEC2056299.1 NAD(P)H-quinone oxidoreductase [Peribacillus psychrosaccharolyticus]MED3743701.1 NAD(P)H-quinone oxidoreductase [Peribacillus psychrosaccharolyticus]QQT00531.1 NAD(P)H-quinone oxidoreductase [Peribacillus psychrosaccharolyticus]